MAPHVWARAYCLLDSFFKLWDDWYALVETASEHEEETDEWTQENLTPLHPSESCLAGFSDSTTDQVGRERRQRGKRLVAEFFSPRSMGVESRQAIVELRKRLLNASRCEGRYG
jgi:hypothetical protein